jgi:lambda family phage tail tape measure protein
MATATQNISIRIAVIDGDKTRREMTLVGEEGKRALQKIREATAPASKTLVAVNVVSQQFRSELENLAGSAGTVGTTLARLGPVGLALAAAFGTITLATVKGIAAFKEAEQSANRLATALKATEFAAGVTAREISALATELQKTTLFSDEQAQDAASSLIYFGNITGETLERAIRLSLDFAQAFGTDVSTAAQQVGKALQDPADGMGRLQNKVGDLTTEQKELIKQFLEANNVAAAQNVILDKLSGTIGGQAEGQNQGLTGATNALSDEWGDLLEEIGKTASESSVAVGGINLLASAIRELRQAIAPTRDEELKDLQSEIAGYQSSLGGRLDAYFGLEAPNISNAKKRLRELNEEIAAEQLEAEKEKQEALRKARDAAAERDKSALLAIEKDFQQKFKDITQTERERAVEEAETAKRRIDALFKDNRNSEAADRARSAVDASLSAKIAKIDDEAARPARQLAEANQKVVESLEKRLQVESLSDPKKRFVQAELDKLNANATDEYRQRVKELSAAIYDKQKAEQDSKEASQAHERALEELNRELLELKPSYDTAKQALDEWKEKMIQDLGGVTEENRRFIEQLEQLYNLKLKEIYDKSLQDSNKWEDGAVRALNRYAEEATNAAKNAEEVFGSASKKIEDTLVDMVSTGEFSFKKIGDLIQSIQQDILRSFIRQNITGPIASELGGLLGGGGGGASSGGGFFSSIFSSIFHSGGVVAETMAARRAVPAHVFMGAPRFHDGLMPDEFPAILQKGETVLPKGMKQAAPQVVMNISTPNAQSFMDSRGQVMAKFASEMQRYRLRNN